MCPHKKMKKVIEKMKKKTKKDKTIKARVTEERLNDIREYCKKNNITASKLINDFFDELLKDKIED